MHLRKVALSIVGLALGCAGLKGYSDFDPNAKFDTYHTYAWLTTEVGLPSTAAGSEGGVKGIDPLLQRRIRDSIDAHLEAKGYRRMEKLESADFAVSFSVGSREKIQVQSTGPTYTGGWYGRHGGWYGTTGIDARSYTEGTLAIDIFDVRSHQAVWHGWASKRVTASMDRAKLVDEAVGAILKNFPPER